MSADLFERHPSRDDLGGFVARLLEGSDAARVEAHVAVCARCAAALAEEARLELALRDLVGTAVADDGGRAPRRRVRSRGFAAAVVSLGLSVAASVAAAIVAAHLVPASTERLREGAPPLEAPAATWSYGEATLLASYAPSASASSCESADDSAKDRGLVEMDKASRPTPSNGASTAENEPSQCLPEGARACFLD